MLRVADRSSGSPLGTDQAMKEVKLPKYESWDRYNEFLPGNVERLCFYWRNGWM